MCLYTCVCIRTNCIELKLRHASAVCRYMYCITKNCIEKKLYIARHASAADPSYYYYTCVLTILATTICVFMLL